jgi:hypothetical protein
MGIRGRRLLPLAVTGLAVTGLAVTGLAVASCSAAAPAGSGPAHASAPASPPASASPRSPSPRSPSPRSPSPAGSAHPGTVVLGRALPAPAGLVPFGPVAAGQGAWRPAGRAVAENGQSVRAVYETTLTPPGDTQPAGIAWLDTGLLAARLYSGSVSPGGGPYRYTAPIRPTQAATLVAAFNGGFKMNQARGGYYTEGRMIDPLRAGAASLVIYADGSVDIGAWGRDVTMTPQVVSVRQNLLPLVADGRPTPRAASARWQAWGSTCGAASCGPTVPGIEHQWRSGLGITADGALVYVAGPALDPLQLAQILVRAGAVRGMQLDINPNWPVFVTYDPPAGGRAAAANGRKLLSGTAQGPWTFFESSWARDFITMSAR